jgi:hypothetical protein
MAENKAIMKMKNNNIVMTKTNENINNNEKQQ